MDRFAHVTLPAQFKAFDFPVTLKLNYTFSANNRIYFSKTTYKDLTNHTYHITLELEDIPGALGMALDFFAVDRIFAEEIHSKLNGKLLNDVLPFNPTAENIAYFIWNAFEKHFSKELLSVTVNETKDHAVTIQKQPKESEQK